MDLLRPGDPVTVIKRHADGHEATRYPGTVVANGIVGDWVVLEAWWTVGRIVSGGLVFEVGDRLLEWFSPTRWFNVFHVYAPDGSTRGWYANVTLPTRFESGADAPLVIWPDLYLDLIAPAGNAATIYDADELEASGLALTDPALHAQILTAMNDLRVMAEEQTGPFGPTEGVPACEVSD